MNPHTIPTAGIVITQNTTFAPGVYHLTQGITIGADNVTLNGEGVLLVDHTRTGVGIHAQNRRGITIPGVQISGLYHGIRLDDCQGWSKTRACTRCSHQSSYPNLLFFTQT